MKIILSIFLCFLAMSLRAAPNPILANPFTTNSPFAALTVATNIVQNTALPAANITGTLTVQLQIYNNTGAALDGTTYPLGTLLYQNDGFNLRASDGSTPGGTPVGVRYWQNSLVPNNADGRPGELACVTNFPYDTLSAPTLYMNAGYGNSNFFPLIELRSAHGGIPVTNYSPFISLQLGTNGLQSTSAAGLGGKVGSPAIVVFTGNGGSSDGVGTGGSGGQILPGGGGMIQIGAGNGGSGTNGGTGGTGGNAGSVIQIFSGNGGNGTNVGLSGGNGGNPGKIQMTGGNGSGSSAIGSGFLGGAGGTITMNGGNGAGTYGGAGGGVTISGGAPGSSLTNFWGGVGGGGGFLNISGGAGGNATTSAGAAGGAGGSLTLTGGAGAANSAFAGGVGGAITAVGGASSAAQVGGAGGAISSSASTTNAGGSISSAATLWRSGGSVVSFGDTYLPVTLFTITNIGGPLVATAETSLLSGGIINPTAGGLHSTNNISAYMLDHAGRTLKFYFSGYCDVTNTAPTVELRLRVGGAAVVDTGAVSMNGVTNGFFEWAGTVAFYTPTNASATVIGQGVFTYQQGTPAGVAKIFGVNTATTTVNTLVNETVDATAAFSAASTLRSTTGIVELVN